MAFRSSYRLRNITDRRRWLDGLLLPPSQEGPAIGPEFPLGSFVEDSVCVPTTGDLDCHNGRYAATPEYPEGIYAYFVPINTDRQPAYPYLIGSSYAGRFESGVSDNLTASVRRGQLILLSSSVRPNAGDKVQWIFRTDAPGFEREHEKPLHLAIVSQDLAYFDHVHPEPVTVQALSLEYTFPHGGRYWLFADYAPVGGARRVAGFEVNVAGRARSAEPIVENVSAISYGIRAELSTDGPLIAGRDIGLHFRLMSEKSGAPVEALDRYLGAWGHIMLLSADGGDFIHAHLNEAPGTASHSHSTIEPSPSTIETTTGFRRAGRYKIWLQVRKGSMVATFPFVVKVGASVERPVSRMVPRDAIPVRVSAAGFEPSRIEVQPGKAFTLAVTRVDAQNCASRIMFPNLDLTKDLPPGRTTLIAVTPQKTGELRFSCGMGMYRGSVVVGNFRANR